MLDLIEDYCQIRKYKFCRLDGSTNIEDRKENVSKYFFYERGCILQNAPLKVCTSKTLHLFKLYISESCISLSQGNIKKLLEKNR